MPPVYNPTAKPISAPADSPSASTASAQSKNFATRNPFFFKKRFIYQGPTCHAFSNMAENMVSKPFKPSEQNDFFKWLVEQEPRFSSLDLSILKKTAILSFHRLQLSVKKFGSTTKDDDTERPQEVIASQREVSDAVRDYKGSLNLLYELLLLKRMFELDTLLVHDENKVTPLSKECKSLCEQSMRKAIEFQLQDFYWESGETKRKTEIMHLLADLPSEVRADREKFFQTGLQALSGFSLELEGKGELRRKSDPNKEIEIPDPIPFSRRYTDLANVTFTMSGVMFKSLKDAIKWTDDDIAKIKALSPKERQVFNAHLTLASYSYDLTKYFGMLFATALDETRLKGEPTSPQVQKITGVTHYPKFASARYDVRKHIAIIIDSVRDLPRIFEKLNLIIANPAHDQLARLISDAHVGPLKRFIHAYIHIAKSKVGKALTAAAWAVLGLEIASGTFGWAKWGVPSFMDFFRGDPEQVIGNAVFVLILTAIPSTILNISVWLARYVHRT